MKTSQNTWSERFLCFALFYATFSKDPSTKVGCVITDGQNRPIGFGTNGFSRTYRFDEDTFNDRPEKYKRVLHAEENAIFNASKSVDGCIAYVTHPPCLHCSHVLAQNGIFKVVAIKPNENFSERWDYLETKAEMMDVGMEFVLIEKPSSDTIIQALNQWQKTVIG
jgi:dCMP deaminase